MKYEIGDKVVIRDDLENYGDLIFTPELGRFLGKTVTISNVINIANIPYYMIEGGNENWKWSEDMIDHERTNELSKIKTYKTWEMLKELQVNPEKEFKSIETYGGKMECRIKMGCIQFIKNKQSKCIVMVDRTWKEVKEHVDFMTAINEFEQFNHIYCETETGEIKRYNPYKSEDVYFLEDDILNGKWFIE